MSPIKSIFILLTFIFLSKLLNSNEDWHYKNHGTDWFLKFENCGKGQTKLLTLKAEELEKSNFFYANLNLKKNTKKNSTLELIENNSILSLCFVNLGNVIYNIKDPWSILKSKKFENLKINLKNLKYHEEDLQEAQCHNIMIKFPCEHIYDN